MTPVPLGARDAAWATACVLLLVAQFAPADWRPALPEDTRSAAAGGQKALVLLAERAGYEVSRREEPLDALLANEPACDTLLVILGPARDLTAEEFDELQDWMRQGGGLLFATRKGRSADFGPLGRIEGNGGDGEGVLRGGVPEEAAGLDTQRFKLFWPHGGEVIGAGGTDRAAGPDGTFADAGALVTVENEVRAARTRLHGGGTAALVAGSAGFSNRSLAWGDNAALAFRLLERAADGRTRVVFDESLNLTGTPKTVALLLDPELRPLTLHLCLLALLWGWWRGRAFGPPLPDPDPPRRTLTDHTDAAGDLAWRTGDGAGVVGWYRRAVAHDLRIPANAGERRKRAAALAAAAGREEAEVVALFDRLGRVDARPEPGAKPTLGRRAAAGLIRDLAKLRAAVVHPRR